MLSFYQSTHIYIHVVAKESVPECSGLFQIIPKTLILKLKRRLWFGEQLFVSVH